MPSSLPSLYCLFVSLLLLLMAYCAFYRLKSLSYVYFWTVIINKLKLCQPVCPHRIVYLEARRMWLSIFMSAALYVSARDSFISRKQTVLSLLERLRELLGEPNSLLAKSVGLLQGKTRPSVCVIFWKCTFLHPLLLFLLSEKYRASNKYQTISLLGLGDGLCAEKYKTWDGSEEFYSFVP